MHGSQSSSFGIPASPLVNPTPIPSTDRELIGVLLNALNHCGSEAINITEAAEDQNLGDMVEFANSIKRKVAWAKQIELAAHRREQAVSRGAAR